MTVLFLVVTIVVFLTIDAVVRRARAKRGVQPAMAFPVPKAQTYPVRIPDGIFFARSHTWLNLFPSGKVRLGVDDFVGRLLEKPVMTFLKAIGESVKKGEPILVLKEGDRSLTIRAPMDGRILARNDAMEHRPELLKEMLFTDGWAYTIKLQHPSELRQMLIGEETRKWISGEFRRLRDVFAGVTANGDLVPALLQDGGPPVAGVMKQLSKDVWQRFEDEFLR
jgi:glycine cleavage system H protein